MIRGSIVCALLFASLLNRDVFNSSQLVFGHCKVF